MMSGFRLFMLPFKKQECKREKRKGKKGVKKKCSTGVQTEIYFKHICSIVLNQPLPLKSSMCYF